MRSFRDDGVVQTRHDAAMANLDRQGLGDGLAGGFPFRLGRPSTAVKGHPTAGARLCSGMPNALADRVVVNQRLTSPVDADWTKQAMFNRIPLGRAGRVVSHRDAQPRLVGNLLEPLLPVMCALAPLELPESARISSSVAVEYRTEPTRRHHVWMALAAKAGVLCDVPTTTKPSPRVTS